MFRLNELTEMTDAFGAKSTNILIFLYRKQIPLIQIVVCLSDILKLQCGGLASIIFFIKFVQRLSNVQGA